MPVKLTSKIPTPITLNGGEVCLLLQRMTVDQFAAYAGAWRAWSEKRSPANGGPSEVLDRFRPPATDAEREELEAYDTWLREVFEAYVEVKSGELTLDDQAIVTGLELYAAVANYIEVVPSVLSELYYAQRLTEEKKRALKLLRDFGNFSGSSNASAVDAATVTSPITADSSGPASAPTAVAAANEASTGSGGVTLDPAESLPGTMADSSSTAVPSATSPLTPTGC